MQGNYSAKGPDAVAPRALEVLRVPTQSEEYLDEWCDERALDPDWGTLEPLSAFLPQIRFVTHDPDGNARPDLSATRTKGGKYRSPPGSGTCIYAPKPESHKLFTEAKNKDIAEGQGKVLSLCGGGYAPLGIGGCWSWRGPDKKLHPWLAAGIHPGDTVRLWIDADWKTNHAVHIATHMLMSAVRALGAKPLLMDISQLGDGYPHLGIDDLRARWHRAGLDVELLTKSIPGREHIENPFVVDLSEPRVTARGLVEAYYSSESGPTLKHWQRDFYVWTGSGWVPHSTEIIRAHIYELMEQHGAKPKTHMVNQVLDALQALVQLEITAAPAWLKPRPVSAPQQDGDLLAVANGLLNMVTGELLSTTPDYFNINWSGVEFDPKAQCPRWEQFLAEIYPDCTASRECLQEYMGYCLTTDTSQQKALALIGQKRSGKGTIARVLQKLVGESAYSAATLASLGERFGKQNMIGKKVAVVAEARVGRHINGQGMAESVLTISGEDIQLVDRKNRDPWEGRLHTRIVLMSNQLPAVMDSGMALASRFLILDHAVSFYDNEDVGLQATLDSELPGILNWALSGLARLRQRRHFVQPRAGQDMIRDWERLGSPVSSFIEDECMLDAESSVPKSKLRERYTTWCAANGITALPDSHFTQALKSAAPTVKPGQDGKGQRLFRGIGLTQEQKRY